MSPTDQSEKNLISFPQPKETTVLTFFDPAKRELELVSSIDEAIKIRDQADAVGQHFRQQKPSLEMQNPVGQVEHKSYLSFEVTPTILEG